ncbi:hypothetical protein ACL6C3_16850 [Capilliphycus salinus ALCB114379]|uniref:hypothetical protein n=1 Tax=Capilliphycus salinus TaxID=2768948 RepID=UPI0039A55999
MQRTHSLTIHLGTFKFLEDSTIIANHSVDIRQAIIDYFTLSYLNPRPVSSAVALEMLQVNWKLPFLYRSLKLPDYDPEIAKPADIIYQELEFQSTYNETTGHAVKLKINCGDYKTEKLFYNPGLERSEDLITPNLTVNDVFLADQRNILEMNLTIPTNRTLGVSDYFSIIAGATVRVDLEVDAVL